MTLRLDKFISSQTSITRSEIKKYISRNKVLLNNKTIRDGSLKIDPETDVLQQSYRAVPQL